MLRKDVGVALAAEVGSSLRVGAVSGVWEVGWKVAMAATEGGGAVGESPLPGREQARESAHRKVTRRNILATRQFGVRDRNTAKSRKAEHWSNSFG